VKGSCAAFEAQLHGHRRQPSASEQRLQGSTALSAACCCLEVGAMRADRGAPKQLVQSHPACVYRLMLLERHADLISSSPREN
jgi:hypothetical protein